MCVLCPHSPLGWALLFEHFPWCSTFSLVGEERGVHDRSPWPWCIMVDVVPPDSPAYRGEWCIRLPNYNVCETIWLHFVQKYFWFWPKYFWFWVFLQNIELFCRKQTLFGRKKTLLFKNPVFHQKTALMECFDQPSTHFKSEEFNIYAPLLVGFLVSSPFSSPPSISGPL